MTVMNSDDMDSNVVGIAAFLYIVGDLEKSIRDPQYNSAGNNLRLEKVWNDLFIVLWIWIITIILYY